MPLPGLFLICAKILLCFGCNLRMHHRTLQLILTEKAISKCRHSPGRLVHDDEEHRDVRPQPAQPAQPRRRRPQRPPGAAAATSPPDEAAALEAALSPLILLLLDPADVNGGNGVFRRLRRRHGRRLTCRHHSLKTGSLLHSSNTDMMMIPSRQYFTPLWKFFPPSLRSN